MKKSLVIILTFTIILFVFGCSSEPITKEDKKENGQEPEIVKTFPAVTDPDFVPPTTEEETIMVRHYEMSDGTWKTDAYSYKYRLEVSGRMYNAAGESTYVILSNRPEISFDEVWKASGFSSNLDDYFDPNETVIVGSIFHSDQKASELQAEGVDTSILVRFNGSLYGRSFAMIDYAGGGEAIGKIERLTEKENIPMVDGETNTKELLGALIYESTSDSIVLFYNNDYVLFEKIEHLESVEFSRDFSVTDDLLYRGESLDIRKLNPCSDENVEK